MEYRVKVYIPSKKSYGYINELKNSDIVAIAKFIQANDEYGLSTYFEQIIKGLKLENIVDKFCVLLQLRGLNLNGNAILKGRHISGSEAEYKVNVFEFVSSLVEYYDNIKKSYEIEYNGIKIFFTLPKKLYFKNFYSLLFDIVERVEVSGEEKYSKLSQRDKLKFLIELGKDVATKIFEELTAINNSSDLYFIKIEDKEILLPSIKISFFNNTIFNTLKSLFKIELTYLYNKFYVCLTKIGLSYKDYMNISFIEADILLSIYKAANKLK